MPVVVTYPMSKGLRLSADKVLAVFLFNLVDFHEVTEIMWGESSTSSLLS